MRGKAPLRTAHSISRRITPAYAGKSSRPLRPPECRKDHPRVCGEKQKKSPTGLVTRGSPPHVRGKGADEQGVGGVAGITPAYAGKRYGTKTRKATHTDHPRVCGEKCHSRFFMASVLGSPPRMRGKARLSMKVLLRRGDHPRVCGEKHPAFSFVRNFLGSPPRMRGKVGRYNSGVSTFRITPAYAGKRLKRSRSTVPPVAIVPLFPSVCNKPVVSDGSPAGRDAPLFLPAENAVPASPAYNLRSL